MQVATRPRMNVPIALVGASAVVAATIALNPAVRPDIHVPALPVHSSGAPKHAAK
jgi:hypothetical protein